MAFLLDCLISIVPVLAVSLLLAAYVLLAGEIDASQASDVYSFLFAFLSLVGLTVTLLSSIFIASVIFAIIVVGNALRAGVRFASHAGVVITLPSVERFPFTWAFIIIGLVVAAIDAIGFVRSV